MSKKSADAFHQLDYLDETDVKTLILALAEGEDRPVSTGECEALVRWAKSVITDAVLLELILSGHVLPSWSAEGDQWIFSLSPKAQR